MQRIHLFYVEHFISFFFYISELKISNDIMCLGSGKRCNIFKLIYSNIKSLFKIWNNLNFL